MLLLGVALLFFVQGISARVIYTQPEQIHLSLGANEDEMVVTWVTLDNVEGSFVEYGCAKSAKMTKVAKGYSTKFIDGGNEKRTLTIHRATMTGLLTDHEYIYHVGSDIGGWSSIYSFRNLKGGHNWSPTIALVGDMGNKYGASLPRLQKEAQKKTYDAIFHIGDFAYDMQTDNARVGDAFMNQIQPIAAYVPYMTAVGNHEMAYNFSNYVNRFTMPGGDGHGMFYSVNIGPVHFVIFSSEFYYYTQYGTQQIKNQFDWLQKDLKEANKPENRARHPWIITMCHRPLYCSNTGDPEHCGNNTNTIRVGTYKKHEFAMEELLYRHGVDIHIQAHEHSYERTWPVYNLTVCNGTSGNPYKDPRAPVHILTGAGGNKEGRDGFFKDISSWSAFRSSDHGYTIMRNANETHISFDQMSVEKNEFKVIDSIVVEKTKHGAGLYDCHKHKGSHLDADFFKKMLRNGH